MVKCQQYKKEDLRHGAKEKVCIIQGDKAQIRCWWIQHSRGGALGEWSTQEEGGLKLWFSRNRCPFLPQEFMWRWQKESYQVRCLEQKGLGNSSGPDRSEWNCKSCERWQESILSRIWKESDRARVCQISTIMKLCIRGVHASRLEIFNSSGYWLLSL